MEHAYPEDLARYARSLWEGEASPAGALPEAPVLEALISACYQASLLREEERPVTFRLLLGEPGLFSSEDGPPDGFHCLEFDAPRPFEVQELRRLSPAADFHRSLIGVGRDDAGGLRIWGLVHSGPRWVRVDQGGRGTAPNLPPVPVLKVKGPGRIEVCRGSASVVKLEEGQVPDSSMNVFDSEWLPGLFAPIRAELMRLHEEDRRKAGGDWAPLDPDLTRRIGQQMVRRVISTVRDSRHGGTLIIVPPNMAGEMLAGWHVALKHKFSDAPPRRRFRALIVGIMNRLAEVYGGLSPAPVGWREYGESDDHEISALDEAIFETAHLIAGLAAIDGAVVMTQRYEILGFGGEISGALPAVKTVARALDVEAESVAEESTEGVGTRHRSAYRLCNELPEALTVVVSQDGGVRFVRQRDGMVTYWDQT